MSIDIDAILDKSVKMKASDLHIKAGSPPIVRIDGKLTVLHDEKRLSSEDLQLYYCIKMKIQK